MFVCNSKILSIFVHLKDNSLNYKHLKKTTKYVERIIENI